MSRLDTNRTFCQVIGMILAAFVLICFFLPWVEIGVKFLNTEMSGYQLAVGNGPAGYSVRSWPVLFLVPASMSGMLILLLLGFSGLLPDGQATRYAPAILILAACLTLGVIFYQYIDMRNSLNETFFGVIAQNMISHLFGWGASIFACGVAVIAGVLDLYLRSAQRY